MKTTPLYEKHVELKGKIIDFGGMGASCGVFGNYS